MIWNREFFGGKGVLCLEHPDKRSCCLAVLAPEPCSLLPLLIQGRDSASEQKCEL